MKLQSHVGRMVEPPVNGFGGRLGHARKSCSGTKGFHLYPEPRDGCSLVAQVEMPVEAGAVRGLVLKPLV